MKRGENGTIEFIIQAYYIMTPDITHRLDNEYPFLSLFMTERYTEINSYSLQSTKTVSEIIVIIVLKNIQDLIYQRYKPRIYGFLMKNIPMAREGIPTTRKGPIPASVSILNTHP